MATRGTAKRKSTRKGERNARPKIARTVERSAEQEPNGGAGREAERSPSALAREERMLDALEEIFLEDGFRRVTIGELAARLRCSRTRLYALAPTKEDLFLRVVDRFLRRIRSLGDERLRAASDPVERIQAYLEPGVSETRSASATFSADVESFPPARRLFERHQRERTDGVSRLVAEGMRQGQFRGVHPDLVAEVMMVAVRRVMQPDFLARANLSMSEAFAEVGGLMRHGLLDAEGTAKAASRARARLPGRSDT